MGVVVLSVTHPKHVRPLWMIVAYLGKRHEPWYLLTSDRIETAERPVSLYCLFDHVTWRQDLKRVVQMGLARPNEFLSSHGS